MKNDTLFHLQVFYEMAMAVGTSLDLNKMLKSSLTIYLKKLSCSSGVIYQTFRHADNQWRFLTRCAIPRNAGKKLLTQTSMPIIPEQLDKNGLKLYLSNLPMAGKTDTGRTFHVMELSGFGILVLVKSGDQIDPNTVQSLIHINAKLAGSAISCLQNEKIEQINQQLSQEIIFRKQAEKTKNQFLANMSHELLTPMNGIIGLNKLLMNSGLTGNQFELANDLSSSAESLLNILKNLFEFSLMNAEKQVLETVNFDLHRLVSDLINEFSEKAVEKNLKLHSTIDPNIPQFLMGDVKKTRQILVHLIDNAIKFTESGEVFVHVYLKTSATEGPNDQIKITFSVEDSGIGIPDQKKALLFETFTQADESDTRKYGGIGLGLAICKKLIQLLSGHIELSDSTTGGLNFIFSLPMGHATIAKTPITVGIDIHVLIVEDNPINRKIIEGICKQLDWTSQSVSDGQQAIDLLTSIEFDLILMDCQMPVMDGYEATRIIRNTNSPVLRHDVPIIAITANISDENRDKCLKVGMDDFIPKPINREKIRTISLQVMRKKTSC